MKKLHLLIVALVVFTSFSRAQVKDSAIIGNINGAIGDSISVPVYVKNLNNVGAIGWYIMYDTSQLAISESTFLINESPLLTSANTSFIYDKYKNTLRFAFTFNGSGYSGISFGSTKLFDVRCKILAPNAALCFDTAYCDVVDDSINEIPITYICGKGWVNKCAGFSVAVNESNSSCNICADGYAWAKVTGGNPPYTYSWNDKSVQKTDTAKGLKPGYYQVTVSDLYDCKTIGSVSISGISQLIVTPATSINNSEAIADTGLLRNGLTISNMVYKGQYISSSGGQMGFFKTSSDTVHPAIGLSKGIILSNGDVSRAPQPNTATSHDGYYNYDCECEVRNGDPTCVENLPGCRVSDADLDSLEGCSPSCTFDATSLEFNFISTQTQVSFRYVFASDEYPNFVCSEFNDIFAIMITGPKPGGGNYYKDNIALIPNTFEPVSINKVNGGVCGPGYTKCSTCELNNTQYYVNNTNGENIVYNGFTKVLTAIADVIPNQKYHIKFAISDVSDGAYDSSLFLEDIYTGCNKFSLVTDNTHASCDSCADGTAWVKVVGGTAPFKYKWNTAPAQTTDTVKGLAIGTYNVCVTDSTGCTVCESVLINSGKCFAHFDLYQTNKPHVYTIVNISTGATPIKYLWSWGDGKFDTVAYPSHTYDTLGYYTICLTIKDSTGCENTYCNNFYLKSKNAMIQVNVIPNNTSVLNLDKQNQSFYVYPNPTSENITIENKGNVNQSYIISIKNIEGQEVIKQCSVHSAQCSVNVSGLSNGVYILSIMNNESGIRNYKVVISR